MKRTAPHNVYEPDGNVNPPPPGGSALARNCAPFGASFGEQIEAALLGDFSLDLTIPPEKTPPAQLQVMFSTRVYVQTIRLEICEAICSIDTEKKFDGDLERYEPTAEHIADELRARLLARFAE